MRVQFKQAVCIDGRDYPRGNHDIPEDKLLSEVFQKFVAAGYISEADPEKPAPLTQEELHAKFVESMKLKSKVVMKDPMFQDEDFKELPPVEEQPKAKRSKNKK